MEALRRFSDSLKEMEQLSRSGDWERVSALIDEQNAQVEVLISTLSDDATSAQILMQNLEEYQALIDSLQVSLDNQLRVDGDTVIALEKLKNYE